MADDFLSTVKDWLGNFQPKEPKNLPRDPRDLKIDPNLQNMVIGSIGGGPGGGMAGGGYGLWTKGADAARKATQASREGTWMKPGKSIEDIIAESQGAIQAVKDKASALPGWFKGAATAVGSGVAGILGYTGATESERGFPTGEVKQGFGKGTATPGYENTITDYGIPSLTTPEMSQTGTYERDNITGRPPVKTPEQMKKETVTPVTPKDTSPGSPLGMPTEAKKPNWWETGGWEHNIGAMDTLQVRPNSGDMPTVFRGLKKVKAGDPNAVLEARGVPELFKAPDDVASAKGTIMEEINKLRDKKELTVHDKALLGQLTGHLGTLAGHGLTAKLNQDYKKEALEMRGMDILSRFLTAQAGMGIKQEEADRKLLSDYSKMTGPYGEKMGADEHMGFVRMHEAGAVPASLKEAAKKNYEQMEVALHKAWEWNKSKGYTGTFEQARPKLRKLYEEKRLSPAKE